MSVNWKGIVTFLVITFGLTYAVEFAIIAAGVRFDATPADAFMGQIAVMIAMWFPALAAFITVRFVTHEDADRFGLRLGAIRPYLI